MTNSNLRDSGSHMSARAGRLAGKTMIYVLLLAWAVVCLFPIYWTVTTSFKIAPNVMSITTLMLRTHASTSRSTSTARFTA